MVLRHVIAISANSCIKGREMQIQSVRDYYHAPTAIALTQIYFDGVSSCSNIGLIIQKAHALSYQVPKT